ncbi:MAG TPA: putative glycoside hydrolase [Spirochaetota bacterium]|nr:putative glycoside hydrolase [Spirochaetota bacterium]
MNNRKKSLYIGAAGIVAGIVVGILCLYGSAVHHAWDSLRSFGIAVTGKILPYPQTAPEISGFRGGCRRIYDGLQEEFIHAGHLLFYSAPRRTAVSVVAKKAIRYTRYIRTYKLEGAIRQSNGVTGDMVEAGTLLYIPHSLPAVLPVMRNRKKPELVHSRGLYYTGSSIGNERVLKQIDEFRKVGMNTVVFDVKDITGIVNYYSNVPDVQEYNAHGKRSIDNIDSILRYLKSRNIYVIARIAVFHDHHMYRHNPSIAIRSKSTGGTWNPRSKELWLDPTNRQAQDYSIGLAVEMADKGVDEIQFDYIRFPTVGNLGDADYAYHFGKMSNDNVITHFLKRAYREISSRNTRLSIDIFGVVAWGKEVDVRRTGQRIESLAQYCDVISPMLYPSHFSNNFNGFPNPGDHPYHFIFEGCKKVAGRAGSTAVRPWLQAFGWRVSSYDEQYILRQVKASNDSGAKGYLFWNASNNYSTVLRAMTILARNKNGRQWYADNEMKKDNVPD